jgi:hypothetical protein
MALIKKIAIKGENIKKISTKEIKSIIDEKKEDSEEKDTSGRKNGCIDGICKNNP